MNTHLIKASKTGLTGGLISGLISGALNYYFLPFPNSLIDNAIGHTISGFFCGLVSAIIGILLFIKNLEKNV